jgi:hypothetical protein
LLSTTYSQYFREFEGILRLLFMKCSFLFIYITSNNAYQYIYIKNLSYVTNKYHIIVKNYHGQHARLESGQTKDNKNYHGQHARLESGRQFINNLVCYV